MDTPRAVTNGVCQSTNNVCSPWFQSRDDVLSSVIAHNVDRSLLLFSLLLDEQSVASYDAISKLEEWQIPLNFNSSRVEDNNMEGGRRTSGLCEMVERGRGKEERERKKGVREKGEGRKREGRRVKEDCEG